MNMIKKQQPLATSQAILIALNLKWIHFPNGGMTPDCPHSVCVVLFGYIVPIETT